MKRLPRRVEPEQLDSLPADDPVAIGSRRDLERLNVLMRQPVSVARLLAAHAGAHRMRRLVDLGGGDGTLLLRLARRLARRDAPVRAVVVDRSARVGERTRAGFEALGWSIDVANADALEWLTSTSSESGTVMLANLFLHHFDEAPLRALLAGIARRAEVFVACEPRRDRLTLAASRMVGWIGCNAVTRHDAVVSVRAGFVGRELTALWPAGTEARIEEGPIGPFSHSFVAAQRAV